MAIHEDRLIRAELEQSGAPFKSTSASIAPIELIKLDNSENLAKKIKL